MLKACFALCVLATLYLPDAAVNRQASDPVAAVSQWEASPVPGLGSWLEGLSPAQHIPAQQVVEDYLPRVQALRQRILLKKNELAQLRYDLETPPDTLPKLGRELQFLRDELRTLLLHADADMRRQAGVSLGTPLSRGCGMEVSGLPPMPGQ